MTAQEIDAARNENGDSWRGLYRESANDRFKKSFGPWFWGSIIVATIVHVALIRFFPQLSAADLAITVNELEAVELPPEVEVPPPPEQIQRPALPVVSEANLEEDVTIAPTTFEENPVEMLPAPSSTADVGEAGPTFTPYTVAPELLDPAEAQRIVRSHYPKMLEKAGIGGTVRVWAFIGTEGQVRKAEVKESSGNERLDEAALQAVKEFRFSPALDMDRKTAVWVSFPITFQVQG